MDGSRAVSTETLSEASRFSAYETPVSGFSATAPAIRAAAEPTRGAGTVIS